MPSTAIAAPSEIAAEAGRQVATAGGSAVDALIAATLTAMCTEPGVCAPGGGGYLTLAAHEEDPVTIDGYMVMPGLDPPDVEPITHTVSMEYGGGITTDVGPGSIAVPGGIAALAAAHQRGGTLPWREVVASVADLLEDGFPLPASCHYYLGFSGTSVFGRDEASRRALHDGERLLDVGEIVHVDGLAGSLRAIAERGADDFYRGELGRHIVNDLLGRGSRISWRDMSEYRAVERPSIVSNIGPWRLATNPPPAVGGVTLSAILRLLAGGDGPLEASNWVEAQKLVFSRRRSGLDLAANRHDALQSYLDEIPLDSAGSGSTINVAVADSLGTVAAATMSGGYGSGVIPTGTGLWMNNSLGEYELNPGGPDATGPGERLISNMAPSVAWRQNRRVAVGSPGADRITSALSIALSYLFHTDTSLERAIEAPRLHVEVGSSSVATEPGIGHVGGDWTERPFPLPDMYFGGVTAAECTSDEVSGYADSRRTGGVAIVHTSP